MNGITRRDLLAASAAGVGIATAGCTGGLGGDDGGGDSGDGDSGDGGAESDGADEPSDGADDQTEDSPESDGGGETDERTRTDLPSLQYVRVENHHDQSHSAHVLVENADEIVHWSSHEVAAGGGTAMLEQTWSDEPGEYVVSIRIDGQTSWTQADLTEERPNCYGVAPRITEDGSVTIWWKRNPEGCGKSDGDGETGTA